MGSASVRNITFALGILSLALGMLAIVISKGNVFFLEACILLALGFVLPFLSFMENSKDGQGKEVTIKLPIKTYLVIAFLTQMFLAPFFYDTFNFQHWLYAADLFAQGINPYRFCYESGIFDIFPYPSMFLYLMLIGREVLQAFGQRLFLVFFKSLLTISNVLAGYFIYKMIVALKGDLNLAKKATCLFIFNPLLVFVTSVQGEFDPLVILFTVLATYFFVVKKERVLSALCLGVGFSLKLYPLLLLPFFLVYVENLKKRVMFTLLVGVPMLLASMPFLILDCPAYINVAFNTGGGPGPFSPWQSMLIKFLAIPLFRLSFTLSLFGAILVTLLLLRDRKLITNIFLCFVGIYLALPFIHENHTAWILPFVALGTKKGRLVYMASLFPFLHLLLFTGAFDMAGLPYWLSSWVGPEKTTLYSIYKVIGVEVSLILPALFVIPFLGVYTYILAKRIYAMANIDGVFLKSSR